jgi:hypothetical protein
MEQMMRRRNQIVVVIMAAVLATVGSVFAPLHSADAQSDQGKLIATGTFIQADPNDTLHWGKGGIRVYEDRVEMDDDFAVGLGPKYRVFLVLDKDIKKTEDISLLRLIDIGRLQHFNGTQRYDVPRGVDIRKFGSVVIFCEGFKVLISPATLTAKS